MTLTRNATVPRVSAQEICTLFELSLPTLRRYVRMGLPQYGPEARPLYSVGDVLDFTRAIKAHRDQGAGRKGSPLPRRLSWRQVRNAAILEEAAAIGMPVVVVPLWTTHPRRDEALTDAARHEAEPESGN